MFEVKITLQRINQSLHKRFLFALKENVVHRRFKPEDPGTESNPHRFGLFTDNPHRHLR
jgi:hypothetical protein